MIRVRVRHGPPFRLEVRGHAGQAPYGEDVVCAAVSALVETLALGLRELGAEGRFQLEEGSFWYEGNPGPEVEPVLRTFLLGFRSLAESHGRYVAFEEGL